MFSDIITNLVRPIHDSIGFDPIIDQYMSVANGVGDNISFGRDIHGLIGSYNLEGISGIHGWVENMTTSFLSHDGIPLPFAHSIEALTDMDTVQTMDWLCINFADVAEFGTELALTNLFKDNPKMYKATIMIGSIVGIIDDNPLLVGLNTLLLLKELKFKGKLGTFFNHAGGALSKCSKVVANASIGVLIADVALGFLHIDLAGTVDALINSSDILPHVSDILPHATDVLPHAGDVLPHAVDVLPHVLDVTSGGLDLIDGIAGLGVGIIASRAVRAGFKKLNEGATRTCNDLQAKRIWRQTLKNNIKHKVSPNELSIIIEKSNKYDACKSTLTGRAKINEDSKKVFPDYEEIFFKPAPEKCVKFEPKILVKPEPETFVKSEPKISVETKRDTASQSSYNTDYKIPILGDISKKKPNKFYRKKYKNYDNEAFHPAYLDKENGKVGAYYGIKEKVRNPKDKYMDLLYHDRMITIRTARAAV